VEAGGAAGRAHQERAAEARKAARKRALPLLQALAGRVGLPELAAVAHGPVPNLDRGLVPLPPGRRAAFLAHLDAILAESFDDREAESGPDPEVPSARFARRLREVPDDPPALAATCMACRGSCCLKGARTHAFLTAESLAFHRHLHPAATRDQVRAAYAAHLPDRHVEGSCVYHGARGCVVPRSQRAEICNHWQCSDRLDLEAQLRATGGGASLVVALPERAGEGTPRSVAVLPSGEIRFHDEVEAVGMPGPDD